MRCSVAHCHCTLSSFLLFFLSCLENTKSQSNGLLLRLQQNMENLFLAFLCVKIYFEICRVILCKTVFRSGTRYTREKRKMKGKALQPFYPDNALIIQNVTSCFIIIIISDPWGVPPPSWVDSHIVISTHYLVHCSFDRETTLFTASLNFLCCMK